MSHIPAGNASAPPFAVDLDPESCDWDWCGLRVLDCGAGESHTWTTTAHELIVLPLAGSCTVDVDDEKFQLHGRSSVFSGTSDFVYVPMRSTVSLSSEAGGRFALPSTRAHRKLKASYHSASAVEVTLRGAGICSRQVNNMAMDGFDADHLMVCEVLTPGGNWSSYPPHKHDQDREGECALEEIYYFEIAATPSSAGMAYQRVYGTTARPIDVLAEVRSGDVVLVPHGWHGPSIAAPGHDLYYLNVMGGASGRTWKICDDPAHAWVRESWSHQSIDPRLPMTHVPDRSDSSVAAHE